ncbi:MAG: hypothetical protein ACYC7D_04610 [Nitrososphaerales archaeon]
MNYPTAEIKSGRMVWILLVSILSAAVFGTSQAFYTQLTNIFSQMGFSQQDPYFNIYFSVFNSLILFLIIPCLVFGAFYFFGRVAPYNARENYRKLFAVIMFGYIVGYCFSYFPIFFYIDNTTTYFPTFATFAATMLSLALEIAFYGIVFSFTGFAGLAFSYFRRQNRFDMMPLDATPQEEETPVVEESPTVVTEEAPVVAEETPNTA